MSKLTNIYKFLYLEAGDKIYAGFDRENQFAIESQIFGMYDYLGQGIIEGWNIYWMGCTSNPYVMQQRQDLLNAYRTDRFSYLAIQYELLNLPTTESEWKQCVVVTSGLGIIEVFHAATEYPTFFRFGSVDHFYVWAQKNACTNTEYLCEIIAPLYPDEDYDLYNPAIYLGEVFTNTVSGNIEVTQISYSQRRRDLKNAQGDVQRMLSQALINHVHSGVDDMPSKINLNTRIIINVKIIENSNAFTFEYPENFNADLYSSIPQVYLDGVLLLPTQYQIINMVIFLQNNININSVLQIIYQVAPGPNIFITNDYQQTPLGTTGDNILTFSPPNDVYYLVDGTTSVQSDESVYLNIFKWNDNDYSEIDLFINNTLIDSNVYILNGSLGTLNFVGPILPSITNFTESQVYIKFIKPSFQVKDVLLSNKIKSIDASSIKSGTIQPFRLSGLDHLGLFRIDEPAHIVPYKKLLDSGDHVNFYPEIDSSIQLIDYIIYTNTAQNIKIHSNESITPSRTLISTANGLYSTYASPLDYTSLYKISWNTDVGLPDIFSDNYFGNFKFIRPSDLSSDNVNPKLFWVLSKSKNQYKNVLYLSTDFGANYKKITIPSNSSNVIVDINDFILTLDVQVIKIGSVIEISAFKIYYIYYLATQDGLYTSILNKSQNPTRPIWNNPSKTTTNSATGSVNRIAEAINIAVNTTRSDTAGTTNTTYKNYRTLYGACDYGLFVYINNSGVKFTTNASNYNIDSSIFNYVKWLGIDNDDNSPHNIIWGDSYGIYYTNSAQKIVTQSTDGNGTSTNESFDQALTLSRVNYTAQAASYQNIDLSSKIISVDGYSLSNNDKVLIKNQNLSTENGIYIWTSSTGLLTNLFVTGKLKILVQNGAQSNTEWVDIQADEASGERNFALWFANLINLDSGDYITNAVLDKSEGPSSGVNGQIYTNSIFVATTQKIYRILNETLSPNRYPQVISIPWDIDKYGLITNIEHYSSNSDTENGILVVFTENGIFKSTNTVFSKDSLDYVRFINAISSSQSSQISVYDDYTFEEYKGEILSIGLSTALTKITDGTYKNLPVYSNNSTGKGLTIDLTIYNASINDVKINSPGSNYHTDISNGFIIINGSKIIVEYAITKGIFTADSDSQAVSYSKSTGVYPNNLLYESDYRKFYIKPWNNFPLVSIKINNLLSNKNFNYNSDIGLIQFNQSLTKTQKDSVLVSLSNKDQYIFNAGDNPHGEVFNITAAEPEYTAKLASTYDPSTAKDLVLPIDKFDNTKWTALIRSVKITGLRPNSDGSNLSVPYTEIVQIMVDVSNQKIFIKSKPTSLPLTNGSKVFIARIFADILGIEDKITLSKSKLTYHLDSVSHANVYKLYNSLLNINPTIFDYPTIHSETLSGVDRGLKNSIALRSLSDFDSKSTFIGYSFGVDPSSSDVAASPTVINLINLFGYGDNPEFTTDKGIWKYLRSSSTWIKKDAVDNSELIYFADITLVDSLGNQNIYAGTEKGLYYISDGTYTKNELFDEPILSINMGNWYFNDVNAVYKKFEIYGKEDGFAFSLRTKFKNGDLILKSDYFDGRVIYDIFYNTFYRFDDNGNKTEHPAIYVATDSSIWGFTTDPLTGSPQDRGPNHYLLVGRQMFGDNLIRNVNKLNPLFPGPPAKIYKIISLLPPPTSQIPWLAVCTSNGVHVIINWRSCDVGDPNGLTFYSQNNSSAYNKTIGRHCFVLIPKSNDSNNFTYFVGTDIGVFKSLDRCYSFNFTSKFGNQELSVNDLKYFSNGGDNYLIATTNLGIWASTDDGDSWKKIEDVLDSNIQISSKPVYGFTLNQQPQQTFTTITSGTVAKAFVYFDPRNLTGITTLHAKIQNGLAVTQSFSTVTLGTSSYPGMYGFAFTNCALSINVNYSLGIVTDNNTLASQVIWGLSSLNDPYTTGYAKTSAAIYDNKDLFFRINQNTSSQPIEIIEPVGYYDNTHSIGFASGFFSGASISSDGKLYSNVGIICNIVLDTSKSFEINDIAINTQSGISSNYVKQAVINSLVPQGSGTSNLYSRLSNGLGTSKFLASVYGFNNSINDLLFFSNNQSSGSNNCFNNVVGIVSGYTNSPSILQSAISYVTNTGRLSKLYDAVLYNVRLQFPAIIESFYANNLNLLDINYINAHVISDQYKTYFEQYLSFNLILISGSNYGIRYGDNDNNFIWTSGIYTYGLVVYSDSTCDKISSPDNYNSGIFVNASVKTPVYFILSNDWDFDTSTCDLSLNYSDWSTSSVALKLALNQYAQSFKPLVVITTDGNDNSKTTIAQVNDAIKTAWLKDGTQLLVIEPSKSGNQQYLKNMIFDTRSKLFTYDDYPENDLKDILYVDDSLNLFTSYWNRAYDFDDHKFISYIYADFTMPYNSKVIIKFRWSKDRINFSNFITLNNKTKYFLNQKVLSIYYQIDFIEDYVSGARILPYVSQLYHIIVIPSIQNYITNAKDIDGQLFEILSMASFSNNNLIKITPMVGRTAFADITYFEPIQINRNACLSNRQTSYRITQAYDLTGLKLFPSSKNSDGSFNYLQFFIVDNDSNIITWTVNDQFILYLAEGVIVSPSAYAIIPDSGIIAFQTPQGEELPNGIKQYETYSATIEYSERREQIIGEPTTTADFKTYYFNNGRIPPDATVIVLVNQNIFRGTYNISPYDGTITFAKSLENTDIVTVFIKFADYFRAGLQIESYSTNNLALQSFNFTYTKLNNLSTYQDSFGFSKPFLNGSPKIYPSQPKINDILGIDYSYRDNNLTPEKNTNITWWRKRTGIEYITYSKTYSLPIVNNAGVNLSGINTFVISSLYNQQENPFILSATIFSVGVTTYITNIIILDRGSNFIGTGTDVVGIVTQNGVTLSGLGIAITAHMLVPNYQPGFATTDYYVRITPSSPIGYSTLNTGYSGGLIISSFPNYDNRIIERFVDVNNRVLFDARDYVYALVAPNNGFATGNTYKSNTITMNYSYAPSVSNLFILNAQQIFDGISTVLVVNASDNQIGIYSYYSGAPTATYQNQQSSALNYNKISWYKLTSSGPVLITNEGILNNSLIDNGNQIFYKLYPGILNSDSSIGYGNTVSSDIFEVK